MVNSEEHMAKSEWEETGKKIRSFTDLIVWKKGHVLVLSVYEATKDFPKAEMFGLTSQLRRSAVSITSNISEGFGRKSIKEKMQFYVIAKGSLYELQNQILIARDLGLMDRKVFDTIAEKTVETSKLLTALIRSTERMKR